MSLVEKFSKSVLPDGIAARAALRSEIDAQVREFFASGNQAAELPTNATGLPNGKALFCPPNGSAVAERPEYSRTIKAITSKQNEQIR